MWFDFTEKTCAMALSALQEAQHSGEQEISTGHLLRGMLQDAECDGTRVLTRLGVSPEEVRSELARQEARESVGATAEPGFTPAARCVVRRAYELAYSWHDTYIGTEHFLLALTQESESAAGRALAELGVDSERARGELLRLQEWRGQGSEAAPAPVEFSIGQPETPDPYSWYHQLRSEDPVHWDEQMHHWVLTRYADVVTVLKSPHVSVERILFSAGPPEPLRTELGKIMTALANQMVFVDPPQHTRLRSLVSAAFTPRVVAAMRPRIQQIVDELVDNVQAQGQMDLIQDLAYPLPVTVIAEMLGVPLADRDRLRKWSEAFFAFLEGQTTLAQDYIFLNALEELTDYFRHLIAHLPEPPPDTLLSALAAARQQNDRLNEAELFANCLLLLSAGHETTVNLIGNGMLALLRHPDQYEKLRQDPTLTTTAVEEFLRYDSPVQWTGRQANADMEIGDTRIAAGQFLVVGLGAANRDPAQFAEPDRLDVSRRENRHVAFGQGIHFCAGAALARLEAQVAFETILQRLPNLRLATDTVTWHTNMAFRRLIALPLAFDWNHPLR